MTLDIIVKWLFLIVAVEAITEIIVDAKISDGFRHWLFNKANPDCAAPDHKTNRPQPYAFLSDLLSCGYCTSVWVAMVAACFAPFLNGHWLVNWLIGVFVIHRLSNCFHIVLMIIKKGRVKTYDIELITKEPIAKFPDRIVLIHKRPDDGSVGQTGGPQSPKTGSQGDPEAGGNQVV